MNKTTMEQVYFDWLLQKIHDPEVFPLAIYTRLLHRLFELSFFWTNPMDVSRLDDALFGFLFVFFCFDCSLFTCLIDCSFFRVVVSFSSSSLFVSCLS